jgi:hypothetical protein
MLPIAREQKADISIREVSAEVYGLSAAMVTAEIPGEGWAGDRSRGRASLGG